MTNQRNNNNNNKNYNKNGKFSKQFKIMAIIMRKTSKKREKIVNIERKKNSYFFKYFLTIKQN